MKLVLVPILLAVMVFQGGDETEKMPWSASNKLTWNDFQGTAQQGLGYVASTSSGLSFSYSYKTRNGVRDISYTVFSNFYPKKSWYLPEHASPYILAHEQAHFDISELFARKLRKRIEETQFSEDLSKGMDSLYSITETERRAFQNKFDAETDHSKNKEQEYIWEARIAKLLQDYERWN